jgi:glycosyltransferase involved in cell wall biosynthesis
MVAVPRVSVIIPCYNGGARLRQAVSSVERQTHPVHEIIVVDDGSTDDTWEVIQSLGSRVRGFRQRNSGPSAARNLAFARSTGNWISYLDADDEWLPHKIERQMAVLAANPTLRWCATNFFLVHPDRVEPLELQRQAERTVSTRQRFEDFLDAEGWGVTLLPSTVVVEASLIREVEGWNEALRGPEDVDLWYRLAILAPGVGYVPEPCVRYSADNPTSLSKTASQSAYKVQMVQRALTLWPPETARAARARRHLRARAFRALMIAAGHDRGHSGVIETRGLGLTFSQRACLATLGIMPLGLRRRLLGPMRDLHRSWAISRFVPADP